MENLVYKLIEKANEWDGTYYEKFLHKSVPYDGADIVRLVIADGAVLAHLLDVDDNSRFVAFADMHDNVREQILGEICRYKFMDLGEFLMSLGSYLMDGDKMEVHYETDVFGNDDEDNLVYSVYNGCHDLMGEYHTSCNVYLPY